MTRSDPHKGRAILGMRSGTALFHQNSDNPNNELVNMPTSETQAAPQGKATPTPAASSTNGGTPPIAKPNGGGLERFKSRRSGTPANVEVLLPPLSHSNIGGSKDFVRLHPNEVDTGRVSCAS
jgi:hypothetical protein